MRKSVSTRKFGCPACGIPFATNFVNRQKQPGGTIRKAIPSTALITAHVSCSIFIKGDGNSEYLYFLAFKAGIVAFFFFHQQPVKAQADFVDGCFLRSEKILEISIYTILFVKGA